MVKRSHTSDKEVPRKKRHIESNDENVDTTNVVSSNDNRPSTSQIFDPTRKSGKIKSIHLRNFMCHANFKVELNKNVNVFVGLNGSGKSAILTAIAIGLGGSARCTERSTSMKDFVKRGESSATVEIVLTNEGIDAYEPEVYGSQITVSRHILASSGSSTYKMKTAGGKVVESTAQALRSMITYFNIQVENPVLILNQDAARSFLKECDPKKLYTLFLKATQLEKIIDFLNDCVKEGTKAKTEGEKWKRSIRQQEFDLAGLREKHERLQSVAKIKQDIVNYKGEIDWLKVIKVEKDLKEIETVLTSKRTDIAKIEDIVKNKSKYDKLIKEQIRDCGTKFSELQNNRDQEDQRVEEMRRELEQAKGDLLSAENIYSTLAGKKSDIDRNIDQLKHDIEEMEKNPQNVENLKRENNAKIAELEKKKSDLEALIDTAKRDVNHFTDTLNDTKEKADRLKGVLDKFRGQSTNFSAQIRNLQSSGRDQLSLYGRSMTELVQRIEQLHKQGKFTELPRGPIGRYIQVTDQKYKQPVENILGNFLKNFIVSCDKDRLLLSNVLKQFPDLARTSIITSKFVKQVYNVEQGKVQIDQGIVLMDVIKCTDPVVMNCLIDQKSIETIVLTNQSEVALELTENLANVPENLLKVYLLEPFTEFYPAPAHRSYALQMNPCRFLQTDFKEVIASYEAQKNNADRKIRELNEEIKAESLKVTDIQRRVNEKRQLCSELQQKDKRCSSELNELRNFEYPEEDGYKVLVDELEDLKRKQDYCVKKLAQEEENVTKAKKVAKFKEEQFQAAKEAIGNSRNEMHIIQNKIEQLQQKLNEMNNDVRIKQNQLNVLKKDEEDYAKQEAEMKIKIAGMVGKITSRRVESKRTEEEINRLIKSAQSRIAKIQESKENIEDIAFLIKKGQDKLDEIKKVTEVREVLLVQLEKSRNARFQYVKKLRQHMALRLKHKFSVLMSLKDFNAEILIDNQKLLLELKVIPRDTHLENAVSNTKSLSGGERSYSTVAFLISLWSCVEHPFYFLDEYDVFSDEHNRHMMTELLFNEARNKPDRQYGFLTPLDFSNIQAKETITIHKLQDPERNTQA